MAARPNVRPPQACPSPMAAEFSSGPPYQTYVMSNCVARKVRTELSAP